MRTGKKGLLLVTGGFPYGECERGFLSTEFAELQKHFRVSVLAVLEQETPLLYAFPQEVPLYTCFDAATRNAGFARTCRELARPEMRADAAAALGAGSLKERLHRCAELFWYCGTHAQSMLPLLARIQKEQNIDLIYTYWCTPATVAALRLKEKCPTLKVVTRFHGYDLFHERNSWGRQPLRSWIAANSDGLLFVTEQGRDYFLHTWGEQWAGKTHIARLGTRPMERLPIPDRALSLVSCSSVISLKRVELIIEALALLPADMPVRWTHIGGGPLLEAMQQLAEERLAGRPNTGWQFLGNIPNTGLESAYARIRPQLFITTSSTEGLPVSVQEAFAMGIPALATAVGGIPDMVTDGQTGFLLPAVPSAQQVAAGLIKFARLPQPEKQALGDNARALWEKNFDAARNAAAMAATLESLLA